MELSIRSEFLFKNKYQSDSEKMYATYRMDRD